MSELKEPNSSLIPLGASIPPIVGEYGYYDSRINKNQYENKKITSYCIENADKETRWCYYSLPNKVDSAYVTCAGVIKTFKNKNT